MLDDSLNEIYVFDAETLHFTQVNRGARENTGYSQDSLEAFPHALKRFLALFFELDPTGKP